MKNKFIKNLIVLLSFTLILSILSPSLVNASEVTQELENEHLEEDFVVEEEVDSEDITQVEGAEIQPFILPLIARVVLVGGQRFLKVYKGIDNVATHPLYIHTGKQGKHILGHPNFQTGKSILRGNADDLLQNHAGKGTMINETKERVNFGKNIGDYFDIETNHYLTTQNGIIHYSKTGAHIVPSKP
ncbi:polymorphic toxin type 50 domain-containing protein [Lysinibacillus sp. FSL K6-0057]|uniref:polymorphic toxin type 50 domain-containing protein n=1 Tax=Lysinibacillus sp. FSL K6-0057 TaxID=2921411 RepID=UPI00315A32C6